LIFGPSAACDAGSKIFQERETGWDKSYGSGWLSFAALVDNVLDVPGGDLDVGGNGPGSLGASRARMFERSGCRSPRTTQGPKRIPADGACHVSLVTRWLRHFLPLREIVGSSAPVAQAGSCLSRPDAVLGKLDGQDARWLGMVDRKRRYTACHC